MTPKEELEQLASAPKESGLDLFLAEIRRHRLLSAAEEVALAKRVERGDLAAKTQMINANLRLVVSIAKRYRVWGKEIRFGLGGRAGDRGQVGSDCTWC